MKILRYVGDSSCSDEGYRNALLAGEHAVVDPVSAERNVTVELRRDGRQLIHLPMAAEVRDLVDLAVTAYIADELVSREVMEDGWTRDLDLLIPVRERERWRTGDEQLGKALSFLSQDRWQFTWPERSAMPKGVHHRARLPAGFDAVCLFSGGIDSLLGACQLLAAGRKVLLVGHQAEPITAAAQKVLARELGTRFPGQVCLVQCRVARAKMEHPKFALPGKVEDSHRPRSFLFLALAVAVARAARIPEVFMPENGLIALNPPLQVSRLGSHSTRTAHPIFLMRLQAFLRAAGVFDGTIRNPFLYESKTDMLRNLDPTLISLVERSVSCSHPSRYQDEGVRHCGYCIPCLYRRAAMMVCGLDRDRDYAFDVWSTRKSLRKGRPLTPYAQADVRALVPFAQRVQKASDVALESIVLAHGYFPPSTGGVIGPHATADYRVWTAMLRRWASDFLTETTARCVPARQRTYGLAATPTHVA